MIGHLTGTPLQTNDKSLLLDVSGVGYKVYVSEETRNRTLGQEQVSLWTHLVVREEILDLYGFLSQQELDFFRLLISVSGIGPKGALGIMNIASVETLAHAIATGDTSYLTKVSGIGKKNADKIVLELRDKMVGIYTSNSTSFMLHEDLDVVEALKALGYKEKEARAALKEIPPDIQGVSQRITEVLKLLGNTD